MFLPVMEIIDVKEQLKKAQALASKVAEKPQDPGLFACHTLLFC